MFRTILICGLLLTVSTLNAQAQHQRTCNAQSLTQQYLQAQGLSTNLLDALPRVDLVQRGTTYTVPVVVHVVYNTTAENVSTGTIQGIIDELNADYSQSNTDIGSVRSQFTSSIGNVGFNFCLAQLDPNGAPTTGITRTQTSQTWFDPDNETNAMKTAADGHAPWNTNRYLNIWICDISSGASGGLITVGYAYLPVGGVVGSNIDGLVIDYNYGTQPGDRTATHEIGHYFGLQHTFDDGGACVNADGFTDTPTTDSPTFSCSNTNLMKCGVLTQYENFMDYANCSRMFTNQQASYMDGVLSGVRSQLLSNNACVSTPIGYCTPTSTSGTAEGDFINGVQLGTINNVNSGSTTGPSYTNYTSTLSTSLARGSNQTITITGGSYQPDNYAAWIDYDGDEIFEASEKLGAFATTAIGQTQTINFVVPAGAALGNTRLRVRGVYHNTGEPTPTDPCFNYAFGETEDYRISITAPVSGTCIPTSTSGPADGDYINSVQLGAINNSNTGGADGPTYTNYIATHSTTLGAGTTQTLLVQGGSYNADNYAAWIDYNQNGVFAPSEKLGEVATTTAGQNVSISFTVPVNALLGSTRMRVRGVYHLGTEPSPTDPCFDYAYGETEDYGIFIDNSTDVQDLGSAVIEVYPNPTSGNVNLVLPNGTRSSISVLDLQGRLVRIAQGNAQLLSLDLSALDEGVYVIRVQQGATFFSHRVEVFGNAH